MERGDLGFFPFLWENTTINTIVTDLILIVDNKQLIMVKDYLSSRNFSQVSHKGPY